MQLPEINLDTITDPAARQLIGQLLNCIEAMHTELLTLRTENQHLRDENARLKGGSGKPDIKSSTPAPTTDHSSEAERRTRTPRGKPKKNALLVVTREQPCVVDPATLPPEAVRHGTSEVLVQDLLLTTEVIRFVREVWLLPSTGQTITAPLPAGYQGAFGPHIQALAVALGHGAHVSQPSLLTFFQDAGVQIGEGTLARWLADHDGRAQLEAQAIVQAGLASSDWHATDQTATRVAGHNHTCHVLGNWLYTVYHTRPGGSRQDVLAVLWGQQPRFRLNADALAWLSASSIRRSLLLELCAALPWEQELSEAALREQLSAAQLVLGPQQQQQLYDALAIAAYHAQTEIPIVRVLLSDDAAVYHLLTDAHALCWVHDGRHYAKLSPVVSEHQRVLAAFRKDYWAYYRKLLAYRVAPSVERARALRQEFADLVGQRTGYAALDERIAKTEANGELLLLVLSHPEIPLHNNDMELAARRRVRKRDVSFGPQSAQGARAWDSFQTMIATATKLGVRLYDYLLHRRVAPNETPSLADHIRLRTLAPSAAPP
jgi:regulator of replication initiation timing